ncbi:ABC transporter permease [Ileibacterium valens]|uniref:ABC3 transporter permease C-terminal domain-containing protein n=2 Tax=Ileibacterium valens TaxID=1862668 RepID=A0A1U7NDB6_9FIRM|nr:ABC transporter permease [Ileibacterium valens]OLU36983.1 hypothetical protein BO222_11325 [Ileibacterium valens]OLU37598.1 hypothetical protein BO224_10525 [Erysipelotrichaceae bacterium NYU-BL-E8]OLU43145.1 hypothetical protein BM735_00945 [Erysipelotrichaceae bacterium NYU-BL-F16]
MRKPICLKLAWQTLVRNSRITLPYLFGSTVIISLLYSIVALGNNPGMQSVYGYDILTSILSVGSIVVSFFAVIFFFYLNSILIKNRKNEMGLFTVLGMEKRHLIRIVFYQLLILFLANIVFGIPIGILIDKVMILICSKFLTFEVPLGFYISKIGIIRVIEIIGIIYLLLFAWSAFVISKENPLNLLKGKDYGETEPKNRWIIGVAGLICLAIGYGISLAVDNPVDAILLFFVAVAFVIAGTYLTFIYGSIMVLKILQSNKRYYYKTRHFISVSSMKYRMKENAASLASIAILSTSVLVGISATTMLLMTAVRTVNNQYPDNSKVQVETSFIESNQAAAAMNAINTAISFGDPSMEVAGYGYITSLGSFHENSFVDSDQSGKHPTLIYFVFLDDFNRIMNTDIQLQDHQIYGYLPMIDDGVIKIGSTPFVLVQSEEPIEHFYNLNRSQNQFGITIEVVAVKDMEAINQALGRENLVTLVTSAKMSKTDLEEFQNYIHDPDYLGDNPIVKSYHNSINQHLKQAGLDPEQISGRLSYYDSQVLEVLNLFGGLFFAGLYLSLMFLFAVILIMYYKQVTEGNADKKRFRILQNVGLEKKNIKQIINDQVLILFFMPLLMCAVHMAFAYPMLSNMLSSAGSFDRVIFLELIIGIFLVYVLVYILIYRLSAKTYYSIVQDHRR